MIAVQGIGTYQMHGDPPPGQKMTVIEKETGGHIAFTGVVYSGSGSFVLPIGKKTFGAIEFTEVQIYAPVRLTLLLAQPLSALLQSSVVWMQNVTFGKGIDPDSAVILTNPEVEGLRLKLVHETKTLENAGRKRVFYTWGIESVPESAPAGQRRSLRSIIVGFLWLCMKSSGGKTRQASLVKNPAAWLGVGLPVGRPVNIHHKSSGWLPVFSGCDGALGR